MMVLVFAIALYGSAFAEPQTKQQLAKSTSTEQAPKADQRGTKDAPLEVNARSVQSDKEATEEAAKDAEQKRVNKWNIWLTLAVAICAFLQVCGIIAQVVVYLKQTRIMKDTLAEISGQAATMKDQLADARSTRDAADVTTKATLAAIQRQADAMETQAEHMAGQIAEARAQVALSAQQNRDARDRERARLIIRNLEMPEILPPSPILNGGRELRVRAVVENLGGSRAFNVRAWGMMNIVSDRTGENYDVGIQQSFPFIIDADQQKHILNVSGLGREFEGIASVSDYHAVTEELAQRIRNGEVFIATSGTLAYEDIFLDTYEAPFHFVWHSFGNDDGGMWLTESYWLDRSPRPRRVIGNNKQDDQPQNLN